MGFTSPNACALGACVLPQLTEAQCDASSPEPAAPSAEFRAGGPSGSRKPVHPTARDLPRPASFGGGAGVCAVLGALSAASYEECTVYRKDSWQNCASSDADGVQTCETVPYPHEVICVPRGYCDDLAPCHSLSPSGNAGHIV